MNVRILPVLAAVPLLLTSLASTQAPRTTNDPFPRPIAVTEGVIAVRFVEFASLPDIAGETQPARMMLMVDEPGTKRLFVNDMRGPIYSVSYDGKAVTPYVDINAPAWGVRVNSSGSERGFQSFAFQNLCVWSAQYSTPVLGREERRHAHV